jgi:hypothetical protein
VIARLGKRRACFELHRDGVKLSGSNRLSFGDLELGIVNNDAVLEVKRMIWRKVLKSEPPEGEDWPAQLAKTLKKRHPRGESYYVTIPRNRLDHEQRDVGLLQQLRKDLPHLDAIVMGAKQADPILVIPESDLIVLIREFLLMLRTYQ